MPMQKCVLTIQDADEAGPASVIVDFDPPLVSVDMPGGTLSRAFVEITTREPARVILMRVAEFLKQM